MKISEVVEPSRIKKLKIELDEGAYCWPEKYQATEFNVRTDEVFDAPASLQLRDYTPDDFKWSEGTMSEVELPDGSKLLIGARRKRALFHPEKNYQTAPSVWEVGFGRSNISPEDSVNDNKRSIWTDKVTGQGLQQRVFATVLEFIRRLIQDHHPDEIIFGVETASGRGNSRASLYHRIANKFAGSLGYEVHLEPDPDDSKSTLFRLIRSDQQVFEVTDNIAEFLGTCVNAFDNDGGECVVSQLPYRDVTDFAQHEEEAVEISSEEFREKAGVINAELDQIIGSDRLFLHDQRNDIYMILDLDADIHYFFR